MYKTVFSNHSKIDDFGPSLRGYIKEISFFIHGRNRPFIWQIFIKALCAIICLSGQKGSYTDYTVMRKGDKKSIYSLINRLFQILI